MICAICGKQIEKNISKDHVFPRSIWKWQQEYLPGDEFALLKSSIESSYNIVKVHPACNYGKEDRIVNLEGLFLDEKRLRRLEVVSEKVSPYIDSYYEIKEAVLKKQNYLCANCGKPVDKYGVLRRVNKKELRTIENGRVICSDCNEAYRKNY